MVHWLTLMLFEQYLFLVNHREKGIKLLEYFRLKGGRSARFRSGYYILTCMACQGYKLVASKLLILYTCMSAWDMESFDFIVVGS